jgi:hypothetical protein
VNSALHRSGLPRCTGVGALATVGEGPSGMQTGRSTVVLAVVLARHAVARATFLVSSLQPGMRLVDTGRRPSALSHS